MRLATLLVGIVLCFACAAQAPTPSPYRWTQFVSIEGQPERVPAEWVATPEGKFAHSIKLPNPLPKDSGYKNGMTSEQYFEHLCKAEAGEFIFKTVEGVEGFYFMRPPKQPTDDDLKDRYRLEDPYTERLYQLIADRLPERPAQFVNPPFNLYKYVEEPRRNVRWQSSITKPYTRAEGYKFDNKAWKVVSSMRLEGIGAPASQYGYTWRGLKRAQDREHAIAGSELIILDLSGKEVMAVLRNYAISPKAKNTPDHIWWLNARSCPQFPRTYQDNLGKQVYEFVSKVLKPAQTDR